MSLQAKVEKILSIYMDAFQWSAVKGIDCIELGFRVVSIPLAQALFPIWASRSHTLYSAVGQRGDLALRWFYHVILWPIPRSK